MPLYDVPNSFLLSITYKVYVKINSNTAEMVEDKTKYEQTIFKSLEWKMYIKRQVSPICKSIDKTLLADVFETCLTPVKYPTKRRGKRNKR